LLFLALTTAFIGWQYYKKEKSMSINRSLGDWILLSLSIVAYGWLAIGVAVLPFF
jgi:hypothetical protein